MEKFKHIKFSGLEFIQKDDEKIFFPNCQLLDTNDTTRGADNNKMSTKSEQQRGNPIIN